LASLMRVSAGLSIEFAVTLVSIVSLESVGARGL
jgi:hypothetical protein